MSSLRLFRRLVFLAVIISYQKPKSLVVWGRGDLTLVLLSKVVK